MQSSYGHNGLIRQAIERSGLRHGYISAQMRLHPSQLSRKIHGKEDFSDEQKALLAVLLRVQIVDLFPSVAA